MRLRCARRCSSSTARTTGARPSPTPSSCSCCCASAACRRSSCAIRARSTGSPAPARPGSWWTGWSGSAPGSRTGWVRARRPPRPARCTSLVTHRSVIARGLAALACAAMLTAPAEARQRRRRAERPAPRIPTPKSVLGFEPGEDRKLAEWPLPVALRQALGKASGPVQYRELGKTTLGAPFVALVISSPQNLRRLNHLRGLNARLADPRTLRSTRETEEALRDGKTVVLITSGIHSTEVGGHLTPVVLAHRLATDTSAATRAILDHVILLLVPSLNPDGVTIVTRWYNRTLGTPAEGTEPPELYHHYAGHDNNRDWYAFTQLQTRARGYNPRQRSWNFTAPWPGGRWALRDIVSYQTEAAYALLQNAARDRDRWLATFLTVGWRAVRGWKGWPYAYVIAKQRQDSVALAALLGILHRGQVEIRTAQLPIALGGQRFAPGSYVVVLRQPYAAFAKTLLEPQHYPDLRLSPGGPPTPPYDVTAHPRSRLRGVPAVPAPASLRLPLSAPVEPPGATPGYPGFGEGEAPRIGLYRSYDASMDEGWTRWVFDTWKVPYQPLVDSVVRAGKLKEQFDAILLPDQEPRQLLDGLPKSYPAPYPGGLGSEGARAFLQFVEDGGTLIALNQASRFVMDQLLLPVRNVLEGVPDDDFYAPGSVFRLDVDTAHAVAKGTPAHSIAWFENGPAFEVVDSTAVRVIARYPADPDKVLASGWVLHPERVAGRAALLEVHLGSGRVILFGTQVHLE